MNKKTPSFNHDNLEKLYMQFQSELSVSQPENIDSKMVTTFNGNKSQPIHRWFTFKEGFSASLLPWISHRLNIPQNGSFSILDPFCGVATSLLSAQLDSMPSLDNLTGIEINPFIGWVAETKLNWHLYDVEEIRATIPKLIEHIQLSEQQEINIPSLSTINNPAYFEPNRLKKLICARNVIKANIPQPEQDFFLLGWSAIIEASSNLRKDGRALRFFPSREHYPLEQLLERQWRSMSDDLEAIRRQFITSNANIVSAKIFKGEDGRILSILDDQDIQYDLTIYSPPYPNNIDYSEVYKLELWLNEFISNQKDFRALRLNTMRSHPSVKFPETDYLQGIDQQTWPIKLIDGLIGVLPQDKDFKWRSRLFRGYGEDMLVSLQNQYKATKETGYVVCIVGNSVHGNSTHKFCVAADIIIAALAREVGFQIDELIVVREFTRRNFESPFNRETILIFRK